jgi:hypothetical protein
MKSHSKIINRFSKKSASNIFPSLSRMTTFVVKSFRLSKNFIIYFIENHLVFYPTPINLIYAWCFGSAAGICLIIQILPGIFLAFSSVEHAMRDVSHGWMICYIHADDTLNRFFGLHFILPFIIAGLTIIHLVLLHRDGSNNPLGVDKLPFYPYFFVKDLHAFFVFLLVFAVLVYFYPNALGHPDNYIPADPYNTPVLGTPFFWQTGFQDPASFLLRSEHYLFTLSIAAILAMWLIACCVYFLIGHSQPNENRMVHPKELTQVTWVWVLAFIITAPLIFHGELWEIPVISLEQESPLPEPEAGKGVNPLWGPPEAANSEMIEEVWWLLREFVARGYSKDLILTILHSKTTDEFWSLGYDQKAFCIQRYLDARDQRVRDLSLKIVAVVCITALVVGVVWLYS